MARRRTGLRRAGISGRASRAGRHRLRPFTTRGARSYTALVHNDLNPTNALVTDRGIRLVDFEGSGFGHIGVDASFLHYPFPHRSANWSVLPEPVTEAADHTYRNALAAALAADGLHGYDKMLAVGAAAALASRVTRLPVIARTNQTPHDSWRRRAQLV